MEEDRKGRARSAEGRPQAERDERKIYARASYAQLVELNIRRHLVPAFGHLHLSEVSEQEILEFISNKSQGSRPVKASTGQLALVLAIASCPWNFVLTARGSRGPMCSLGHAEARPFEGSA